MADNLPERPSHVLQDPSAQAVARMYGRAFLAVAEEGQAGEVLEELTSFYDDVVKGHPEFGSLLLDELISGDEKLRLIERVVAPRASELLANFLRVLAKHERLSLLPTVLEQSWREFERLSGQTRVQITSAVELGPEQIERIRDRLRSALSADPIVVPEVDPSLIGGLIVRVDDTIYDGSLRTRLQGLQRRLRERYLNEIQVGRDRFSHPAGN